MRSAWGKGYATEGSRALIRKGFTELGVRRVWAQTMAVNLASRRVMEKASLAYVRTWRLEWEAPLPGAGHGEVEYTLTKADWEWRQAAGRGRPRTSTSDSALEPSATGAGEATSPNTTNRAAR